MLDGGFEHSGAGLLAEWVDAEVRTQAVATGYANAFEAIRASVPWRPALSNDAGQPLQRWPRKSEHCDKWKLCTNPNGPWPGKEAGRP